MNFPPCPDCKGEGNIPKHIPETIKETRRNRDYSIPTLGELGEVYTLTRVPATTIYRRCRNCHGSGVDPAEVFRWRS